VEVGPSRWEWDQGEHTKSLQTRRKQCRPNRNKENQTHREINTGLLITNRQKFLTLSSLVEGLELKVTGSKMSKTSDDSLFATGLLTIYYNII